MCHISYRNIISWELDFLPRKGKNGVTIPRRGVVFVKRNKWFREEVETRKIGRNEARSFQGLFPIGLW